MLDVCHVWFMPRGTLQGLDVMCRDGMRLDVPRWKCGFALPERRRRRFEWLLARGVFV